MSFCERCKSEIRKEEKLKKADKRSYWPELIDHIKTKWEWRYRPDGKFDPTGQDMALLRRKTRVYAVWDLMAMYDQFIHFDDIFWIKRGYSITVFCEAIPRILDHFAWKEYGKKYREKLEPIELSPAELEVLTGSLKAPNHVQAVQRKEGIA